MDKVKRFLKVLLVVEILVILLLGIPFSITYLLVEYIGSGFFCFLIVGSILIPWYAALYDYIKRSL